MPGQHSHPDPIKQAAKALIYASGQPVAAGVPTSAATPASVSNDATVFVCGHPAYAPVLTALLAELTTEIAALTPPAAK